MSSQATALNGLYRPIRVAYPIRTENRAAVCMRFVKAHWKKITVAIAAGVFAGFLAGAVGSKEAISLARVVYAATPTTRASPSVHGSAAVPASRVVSAGNQDTVAEVSRLRAQNQELQALVQELRKQPQHVRTHRARARRHAHGRAG
jgi:hypothetical protein